jgi:hypothetical protein
MLEPRARELPLQRVPDWCVGSRRTMRQRRYPMSITGPEGREWHLRRKSSRMELQATGDWVACQTGIRSEADVHHIVDQIGGITLRINSSGLGQWDSALIAFHKILRETISKRQPSPVRIDEADLPEPAKRLLALATCAMQGKLKPPPLTWINAMVRSER